MKILVVDDHPMFREGLAGVLRQWPPVSSVLQASDGEPALALVAEQPDLAAAIVDLRMSGTGGLVVVAQLRRLRPDLPVLVLSSSEDPEDVRRALAAGAAGYCPKSAAPATLLAALQLVLAGEVYVPPLMAQAPAAPPSPVGDGSGLTPRQREVLQQLCQGQTNKQIARILDMQEKTVKGHVSAIFKALNVVHRLQAIEAARNAGLVG
jgi:two-component system, NarL family, nitrate/nitrite response regulator NarL